MSGTDPVSRECEDARDRFAAALEDKAEENAVLDHCLRCKACMAAFTELKETVEKLVAAASALPKSDTFASSVFMSIRKEKARKRNSHLLLFSLAVVVLSAAAAGITLLAAGNAGNREGGEAGTDQAPGEQDGRAEPKPEPSPVPPPGAATEDKKPEAMLPGEKPALEFDEKAVSEAYASIMNLVSDLDSHPNRQAGPRKKKVLEITEKCRSLGKGNLKELLKRLENHKPSGEEEKRILKAVYRRCRELLDGNDAEGQDGDSTGNRK